MIDYKQLVYQAYEAQRRAYCPYSHWAVGAALLTAQGKVYLGCNIESSTFTPSNCAERTAFFKAVSEGERDFVAIAVVGNDVNTPIGKGDICPPCGVCRQVMTEFCKGDFEVIMAKSYDEYVVQTLDQLMPYTVLPLSNKQ